MSLSLLKPPEFVLTDDLWPVHSHGSRHSLAMLRTQIPSAALKTLWNSFYWSHFCPSPTKPVLSPLSCPAPQVMPPLLVGKIIAAAQPLPELPILTMAAFPCRFLKPQRGCPAQHSQNLATPLFPGPVLDAGPAVGTAAQGSSSAGEAGVAPHR